MHSQMDQIASPKMYQFILGNYIYDRGGIANHQMDELFNKWHWDKKLNLYPYFIKKQFQMNFKDLNLKCKLKNMIQRVEEFSKQNTEKQ